MAEIPGKGLMFPIEQIGQLDMRIRSQGREGIISQLPVIKSKGNGAVRGNHFRKRGSVANHYSAEGKNFRADECDGGKKQYDAANEHGYAGELFFQRGIGKKIGHAPITKRATAALVADGSGIGKACCILPCEENGPWHFQNAVNLANFR